MACADPCKPETEEPAETSRQIDSRPSFGRSRVLTIQHGEDVYTLRITRAQKLILTK